jgi:RNA recognition motif-containing protein
MATKVYIGRLSSRTRERDIDDAFSKYGKITKQEFKAGFAFVVSYFFIMIVVMRRNLKIQRLQMMLSTK